MGSAEEALARIDAGEEWDAILCDFMMPGMDGIGFYESLEARHPRRLPRVVVMRGGAFGDRAERFLAESNVAVVPQPVARLQLLGALAEAARRHPRLSEANDKLPLVSG